MLCYVKDRSAGESHQEGSAFLFLPVFRSAGARFRVVRKHLLFHQGAGARFTHKRVECRLPIIHTCAGARFTLSVKCQCCYDFMLYIMHLCVDFNLYKTLQVLTVDPVIKLWTSNKLMKRSTPLHHLFVRVIAREIARTFKQ